MLTYAQLAKLESAARDQHVLNVYVNPAELDAVSRRSWRRTLTGAIDAGRKAIADAPHAERTAFDRAATRVQELTGGLADDLGGAFGWAAFVTADETLEAGVTSRPPRTGVHWRQGIAVAPYLRLFEDDAPVIVAVVDARRTDVYRWNGRDVDRVERVHAHAHLGRAVHMGEAPQQGFHSGTRGTTLTDAAQHALDAGRERMLHDVAEQLETLARPRGWMVFAGIRTTVNDAIKHLGKAAQKRALYLPGLSTDASEPEIARAAAEGRQRLEGGRAEGRVAELIDRAAGRGRAVVGFAATLEALRTGAARDVLVTPAFLDGRPEDAEAVGLETLTHGARLSEIAGTAAERLDGEAEGIAATLRFPGRTQPAGAGLASAAVG